MERIGEAPPPDYPSVSEMDFQEVEDLAGELHKLSTAYARMTGDYDMANALLQAGEWMNWANEQLN